MIPWQVEPSKYCVSRQEQVLPLVILPPEHVVQVLIVHFIQLESKVAQSIILIF